MNPIPPGRALCYARSSTTELHEKAVTRVIELLRSDPGRTWRIKEMARAAFMSPFHFIRVFQEVAGIAPCKFQWALKLRTAKQLLLLTDLSIFDISERVGYKSFGTFARRFSELVALSPNRFRHLARTTHARELERAAHRFEAPEYAASSLRGRVHVPPRFYGTVILACFPSRIPHARPLQLAAADSSGAFSLPCPKLGTFYLHAFGIPRGDANTPWFTDENLLRGSALCTASADHFPEELFLRGAQPTDPPVLLAMGALIARGFPVDMGEGLPNPESSLSLAAHDGHRLPQRAAC
jgi:AraC family transcriptional regulator